MKIAVVGHIEWGRFVKVDNLPKEGEITHALDSWQEVAGGGAVAAMQLAKKNGTCLFFTAVGDDELGKMAIQQLEAGGVEVYATIVKGRPTREAFIFIDNNKERTITVTPDKFISDGDDITLPWEKLSEMDAVYFVSGNQAALQNSRMAKKLVSTARILTTLQDSREKIDALVCSKKDIGELYKPGDLSHSPGFVVVTNGINGGQVINGESYFAINVPNDQLVDTYGCGDSFAAGITYGFGMNHEISKILEDGARLGAEAAIREGSFNNRY